MTNESAPAQYLTFILGDEVFGMEIRTVREIIQHSAMTVVPLMPAFVRGAVVPVIDLKSRFGRGNVAVSGKTCVVIFDAVQNGETTELGLMVDAVSEVLEIAASDIEPPPQFGSSIAREFISGLSKVKGEFIVLLAAEHVLNVDDMTLLAEQAR